MITRALLSASVLLVASAMPAFAGGGGGGGGSSSGSSSHGAAPAAEASMRTNVHVSSLALPNDLESHAETAADAMAPPEGPYVDLPAMNVPVVRSGRLMGYSFVVVRVHLDSSADEWRVRDRTHLLMDAAIRAMHQTPFVYVGHEVYDAASAQAEIAQRIESILSDAEVSQVELIGGDVRLLRS
ncbi:hypothetical protein [Marinicauda sp. Alg238-R41]|uniref:hypothetical protein n=1 Tax=Marinicauda sp. Alg238-R41 TaxID=2993447 RepID=UPI0022E917A0|nr:hypothetical protein [Marinicauda sp. Alg238-R41]